MARQAMMKIIILTITVPMVMIIMVTIILVLSGCGHSPNHSKKLCFQTGVGAPRPRNHAFDSASVEAPSCLEGIRH